MLNVSQANAIIHGLSKASKMPCASYSIPAFFCKRGAKLSKIPGSVCNKCYAKRGNFLFPSFVRAGKLRVVAMKRRNWPEAMSSVLNAREHSGFFRWFASGDLQSLDNLLQICKVCRLTPHIQHWLPTREIGLLAAFKKAGHQYPENLTIRLSADMIGQKPSQFLINQLGVLGSSVSKDSWTCPASKQGNNCGACRDCWNKKVAVVTYKYH